MSSTASEAAQLARAMRGPSRDSDLWLFAVARQAVVILDVSNPAAFGRIVEANHAACSDLGLTRAHLLGTAFTQNFAPTSVPAVERALALANQNGRCAWTEVCPRGAGSRIGLTLSLVHWGDGAYLLAKLFPIDGAGYRARPAHGSVLEAIERAPDGFLVTDTALRLTYANQAFLRMTGVASATALQGESIARWMELTERDLQLLTAPGGVRQAVTLLRTSLRQHATMPKRVELWAIPIPDAEDPGWAFRIRTPRQRRVHWRHRPGASRR